MEVNTEADDVTECSQDDEPTTGVCGFYGINIVALICACGMTWPQYTNATDRQVRQRSDGIANHFTNGRLKMAEPV